jgi:hypothetical protein
MHVDGIEYALCPLENLSEKWQRDRSSTTSPVLFACQQKFICVCDPRVLTFIEISARSCLNECDIGSGERVRLLPGIKEFLAVIVLACPVGKSGSISSASKILEELRPYLNILVELLSLDSSQIRREFARGSVWDYTLVLRAFPYFQWGGNTEWPF